MKKFLPTSTPLSVNKTKGFTLVELLVVIAIIAVLAMIGFAVFSGLTGRGNDARRQADIKAIADAYEVRRAAAGAADYGVITLAATDFASGAIPADPDAARQYCFRSATTGTIGNATVGGGITAVGVCQAPWAVVGAATPANTTVFKVCVLLANNTTITCVGSKQ